MHGDELYIGHWQEVKREILNLQKRANLRWDEKVLIGELNEEYI